MSYEAKIKGMGWSLKHLRQMGRDVKTDCGFEIAKEMFHYTVIHEAPLGDTTISRTDTRESRRL